MVFSGLALFAIGGVGGFGAIGRIGSFGLVSIGGIRSFGLVSGLALVLLLSYAISFSIILVLISPVLMLIFLSSQIFLSASTFNAL